MPARVAVLKNDYGRVADAMRRNAEALVKETALTIANEAKQRAPVETGTLRRSLHVEETGDLRAEVGTDLPYAARLEFGFVGADSRGRVYSQAPRPYLLPASEAARPAWERGIKGLVEG